MTNGYTKAPIGFQFSSPANILKECAKAKEIMDRLLAEEAPRKAELDRQITAMVCPQCGRSPLIIQRSAGGETLAVCRCMLEMLIEVCGRKDIFTWYPPDWHPLDAIRVELLPPDGSQTKEENTT